MKGQRIKVRFTGDDRISEDELIKDKLYDATYGGVGYVNNPLFKDLIDEQGDKWSGQLDGNEGFRISIHAVLKPTRSRGNHDIT